MPEGPKQKRQKDSRSPRRFAQFESHSHFRRFWTAAVLLPLFKPSSREHPNLKNQIHDLSSPHAGGTETKAAERQPQSKTLRAVRKPFPFPKVLDCGCPSAAFQTKLQRTSKFEEPNSRPFLTSCRRDRNKSGRKTAAVQDASRSSKAIPISEGFGLRLSFCRFSN